MLQLSHFKYPSAWRDELYFCCSISFLLQANPVNTDPEGAMKSDCVDGVYVLGKLNN